MTQFFSEKELLKIQLRIELFGKRLSPEDREEFRRILHDMAGLYFGIAEVYKTAEIHLIPSKLADSSQPTTTFTSNSFKPSAKPDKGNPLAELLGNLSEADKAKLVGSLEQNLKKE